jgi:hypothetical protein
MADIKNTQELVKLVVALSSVLKNAQSDGKVDLNDLVLLVGIIPFVGPAIEGISDIPEELKDLDATEIAELSAEIAQLVGGVAGDTKYVGVAEHALKAAFEIFKIVKLLK